MEETTMTKLRFLLLIAIILQLPFHSIGQFSREQAKTLVLKQILAADTGLINVYSSYDTISGTDSLILLNNEKIPLPYAYNWVFFSDDNPLTYWYHPCRYVIVNSSNGDDTIENSDIYPVNLQTGYEPISLIVDPPTVQPPCTSTTPTYASPNPHLLFYSPFFRPRFYFS